MQPYIFYASKYRGNKGEPEEQINLTRDVQSPDIMMFGSLALPGSDYGGLAHNIYETDESQVDRADSQADQ